MLSLRSIYLCILLSVPGLIAQERSPTMSTINAFAAVNTTVATESKVVPMTSIKPMDPTNTTPSIITISDSSSAVFSDISSLRTATSSMDKGDDSTHPSWELIYPDQNSTFTDDSTTLSMSPKTMEGMDYKSISRYFKVDDVTNCEKFFGECLRQVLAKVIPKLRNGDDDAHIPPMDPFFVNRTSFQYNGGPLNGHITVAYAYVYGLTSMKYRKVIFKRGSGNTFKLRLSTVIPNLQAKGSYKADLKVNSVNVRPKGDFNITLYGVAVEQLASGEIQERDDHRFLKLTTMNVTAGVRDAKLNATGLIPDMRLNEIILNVTNQYWREIFNILLPETRDNWMPVIRNALNGALSMVPFDFLKKM